MGLAGRVVSPLLSTMEQSKQEWLWRDSALVKLRRTVSEAKQLPAKAMIIMEDLPPTSLPGQKTAPHGAMKYSQIGADAAEQILSSAVVSWQYYFGRMLLFAQKVQFVSDLSFQFLFFGALV